MFKNSIENHKNIYHHFLDGVINTTVGNRPDLVFKDLNEHKLLIDNIYTLKQEVCANTCVVKFYKLNEQDKEEYKFNYYFEDNYYKEDTYIKLKEYLNFCIYLTGYNDHLTSSLIFIKNNKLYFFILNSGQGMNYNNENSELIESDEIYQLTKGIVLCEHTDDERLFKKGVDELTKILFISYFYTYINNNQYVEIKFINSSKRYEIKEQFTTNILPYIKKISKFDFKIEYLNKKKNIQELNISQNTTLYDTNNFLNIINSYYEIIAKNMDSNLVNISDLKIVNLENYSWEFMICNNTITELKGGKDIKDFLIKKIILYYTKNNFYIIPQHSGSCSWFSIYYSIMLYFVINDNFIDYKNFIININRNYYDYINLIFTKENFLKELDNHIYMKKMCSKLIDIGILKKNILFEVQDIIYDCEGKVKYTNKNDYILIYKYNYYLLFNKDYKKNIITEIKNIKNSPKEPIHFYFTAYEYFLKENKGKYFFKIKDDDIIIKKIDSIEEIDSDNILYYIYIYKQTYTYKFNQPCPSCVFYFLPMILYINYNKRLSDVKHILLDFNDNKEQLFKCCITFYRLYIYDCILYRLFEINKDEKYKDKDIRLDEIINTIIDSLLYRNDDDKYYYLYYYFFFDQYVRHGGYRNNNINIINIFNNSNNIGIDFIEAYYTTIDDYLIFENYLYNNKEDINENFLVYNIERITHNKKIEENLIKYYSEKIYLKFQKNIDLNEELRKLIILLYKIPFDDSLTNPNIYIKRINNDVFLNNFLDSITKLCSKSINILDFINKINTKREKIYIHNVFNIITDYDENTNMIQRRQYFNVELREESSLSKLFKNIFLIINFNFLISEILEDSLMYLYQIINENIIKYEIELNVKEEISNGFKINKIYFNDNDVYKFSDIIYPFKYIIPNTSFFYIYQKNNIYNISFFIKKFSKEVSPLFENLLGEEILQDNIYNFDINPNTQFLLNKNNYDLWNKLCIDYQVNYYNIIYVNFTINNNDYYISQDNSGYSCNKKIYINLCDFDKEKIIKENIKYEINNFNLLINKNDNPLLDFKIKDEMSNLSTTIKKLFFKISNCSLIKENIDLWKCKLENIKRSLEKHFFEFTKYLYDINLNILINDDNYDNLQNYLLEIKIYNFINKVLLNINNQEFLCSLVKNYKILFDTKKNSFIYKFEILFELINGNEILEEQNNRYIEMINSYIKYNDEISSKDVSGGAITDLININIDNPDILNYDEKILEKKCEKKYPLHHFMMGKGKSAIITPLLALYFNIIKKKIIYVIVPKHLVKQTEDTIKYYLDIFKIDDILILSEDQIKFLHIHGKILKDSIFLIDEIDSLIDPTKSNFNFVNHKEIEIKDIGIIIKDLIIRLKDKIKNKQVEYNDISELFIGKNIINQCFLTNNLIYILNQLNNNLLKFNIMWGIDKNKLYAIPYRSKDKPLENSSFSSIILTLFLTFYYYIIQKDNKIDENILNFIIKNNIHKDIFYLKKDNSQIDIKTIQDIIDKNLLLKQKLYDIIYTKIFSNLLLPKYQYNTSFVDIINIDNIFKIGYSGTINMNLPILKKSVFKFSEECIYEDNDEKENIYYAIRKSEIIDIDLSNILDNLNKYDALIDVCGYYYKELNNDIAKKIHEKLKRIVIFINEDDNKMVIINNKIEKYNEYYNYTNPFFYYDQAHIVGIDIKQDNYPILKGICIVDTNSGYSEVAQAMYRLRKLNLGHEISFILNKFIINYVEDLLQHFIDNEKKQIDSKKKSLNFQALKSEIRKLRNNINVLDNYEEEKFYFYNNKFKKEPLDLIFKQNEIRSIKLEDYELSKDDIKNIIFDIDIMDKQTNVEQESNVEHQSNVEQQNETNYDINYFNFFPSLIPSFTNFKNYNFLSSITNLKVFDDNTFKIDDHIHFLPNIFLAFTNGLRTYFWDNISYHESDLILIYFSYNIKKFLILPKYTISEIFDKFVILDINLNIISDYKLSDTSDLYNKIDYLKKNNLFFKITNNTMGDRDIENFLSVRNFDKNIFYYMIILYRIKIRKYYNDSIFIYLKSKLYITISSKIVEYFRNQKNDSIYKNIEQYLRKVVTTKSLRLKNKYLKYKKKYLSLKKL
jgi:hypothetical protein